ncbi:MAG: adenine deaminase [Methanoregulaceae archaeon]
MKENRIREHLRPVALGQEPADIVFRNAEIYNPFSCGWEAGDLAVKEGYIAGIGGYRGVLEVDLRGKRIVPGLLDAHVHIESSLLTPYEYGRLVLSHGTTTVVADPHEIANVCGKDGIEYLLAGKDETPLDIFLMLPSCVPATPLEEGGATLTAADLKPFLSRDRVLGLAEMMNVPGVLAGDPEVEEKLALTHLRDGHAPLLSGKDLNAYVLSGLQSDHECTRREEAEEKLRRGMYIFIREGSTERNIQELAPLGAPCRSSRCAFATDDCHADLLDNDGHIDRCIRSAVETGLELEIALRMATLTPAERFGLSDRGALSPGRLADFCVLDGGTAPFAIQQTFKRGILWKDPGRTGKTPRILQKPFACSVPDASALQVHGSGKARVIGLVPGQIVTEDLMFDLDADEIPDTGRDILKVIVCSRYREHRIGLGLVHGFGFAEGAIAASISHDSHNVIAVGVSDEDILRALALVIKSSGGMVAVTGKEKTALPLACAGLMSSRPFEEVVRSLDLLRIHTERMGAIPDPFMYLSFLALTVIPSLRVTDRGLFDVQVFRDVGLFTGS